LHFNIFVVSSKKSLQVESLESTISRIKTGESEREYELAMERKKKELDRLEKERAEMEAQVRQKTSFGSCQGKLTYLCKIVEVSLCS